MVVLIPYSGYALSTSSMKLKPLLITSIYKMVNTHGLGTQTAGKDLSASKDIQAINYERTTISEQHIVVLLAEDYKIIQFVQTV